MILTLKGITGHGKNRIREHGDKWEVLEASPRRSGYETQTRHYPP